MVTANVYDFDIQKIADSGQCFRINHLYEDVYSVVAYDRYIEVRNPKNSQKIDISCPTDDLCVWSRYFDLHSSYYNSVGQVISSRYSNDKFLKSAVRYGCGIRILNQDFFETLISFIISQRKSIPAIKGCIEKLCTKYGAKIFGRSISGAIVFSYAFPKPDVLAGLSEKDLREIGVGYRAKYIVAAAKWFIESIPERVLLDSLGYEDAYKTLQSEILGVGKKVASCVCLFGLHQLNACPIDVWMQKIIDEDYNSQIPPWMDSDIAGLLQQFCFFYKRSLQM